MAFFHTIFNVSGPKALLPAQCPYGGAQRTLKHKVNHSVNGLLKGNPAPRTKPFRAEAKLTSTGIKNSLAQSRSQCQGFYFGVCHRRKCLTDSEIQTGKQASRLLGKQSRTAIPRLPMLMARRAVPHESSPALRSAHTARRSLRRAQGETAPARRDQNGNWATGAANAELWRICRTRSQKSEVRSQEARSGTVNAES